MILLYTFQIPYLVKVKYDFSVLCLYLLDEVVFCYALQVSVKASRHAHLRHGHSTAARLQPAKDMIYMKNMWHIGYEYEKHDKYVTYGYVETWNILLYLYDDPLFHVHVCLFLLAF